MASTEGQLSRKETEKVRGRLRSAFLRYGQEFWTIFYGHKVEGF